MTNSEPATQDTEPPGLLSAARAFGVVAGGTFILNAAGAVSVAVVVRSVARRRRPSVPATVGTVAAGVYFAAVRPWMRRWGATRDEAETALPGDELLADAPWAKQTRAITIDAPVDAVWPWLAQIGQDRGGFYSYEWLENLAGCKMHNAQCVHAEWQHRTVGDQVRLHPSGGLRLLRFDPNEAFGMEGGWNLALKSLDPGSCRLYARSRQRRNTAGALYVTLIELPHFIMERKMLLGIKQRAEKPAYRG
ncbi:MAG TPA: hypothetical protein VGC71_02630 [Gaiellales bacterium]|jgi:hypothetical protein